MAKKIIIIVLSAIIIAGCAFGGGYALGFHFGYNDPHSLASQGGAYEEDIDIVGVYERSYYNNYNKQVREFVSFSDNGGCNMFVRSEESADDSDFSPNKECSYTYDKESSVVNVTWNRKYTTSQGTTTTTDSMEYYFKDGVVSKGGAIYTKNGLYKN